TVVLFGAENPLQWLERLALATAGALPATLLWLLALCSGKALLARLSTRAQWLVGCALGMAAGALACAVLSLPGMVGQAPWLAC
ncbi:hypothetical protein ACS2QP_28235, partial [Bacillus cereus group sp. Bce019]|uniref:hypothetical protein n=1 Tax=Bacillus cereus group sp. Bce019 TaxID=3445247 RepID=UPI003F1F30D5